MIYSRGRSFVHGFIFAVPGVPCRGRFFHVLIQAVLKPFKAVFSLGVHSYTINQLLCLVEDFRGVYGFIGISAPGAWVSADRRAHRMGPQKPTAKPPQTPNKKGANRPKFLSGSPFFCFKVGKVAKVDSR